jgi:hypothetical protein
VLTELNEVGLRDKSFSDGYMTALVKRGLLEYVEKQQLLDLIYHGPGKPVSVDVPNVNAIDPTKPWPRR